MEDIYRRRQSRKRLALSILTVLSAYASLGLIVLLVDLVMGDRLNAASGPMKIRLGSPAGVDDPALATVTLDPVPPAAAEAAPAEAPPPEAPTVTEVPTAAALPESDTGMAVAQSSAAPRPSKAPSPRSSMKPQASQRPGASAGPQATKAAPSAGSPGPAESAAPRIAFKGSESGNAWESSFESGSGKIGRGLYVPIYLFMPLPYEIDAPFFEAIPAAKDGFDSAEERKKQFLAYYRKVDNVYQLKAPPPVQDRPRLWLSMADAGFPISKAAYKEGKYLRTVELKFRVGSTKSGEAPALESVELVKSSGYSDVDEAVLYGFRQASFYNDSPRSVSGVFRYSFE
jgi:outer membrane biosynthesis protein TonB